MNEQHPYVIKCGVEALSNELKHPEVAKFVLAQVDNESPFVRRKVAIAVGNSWSKGVDGVKEAALKLMADLENLKKTVEANSSLKQQKLMLEAIEKEMK